jgi:hypothetical protein
LKNCSENALILNLPSAREGGRMFILWGAETSARRIGIKQFSWLTGERVAQATLLSQTKSLKY